MREEIEWGRRKRPLASEGGHDVIRFGSRDERGHLRTFIECQCGSVLSGWGWGGAQYGHKRHAARAKAREQ